ncbi:hypothetical protein, partial [Antarctobacter jejuensis]|uniref:hypothetical protein n=1 Tax=Antarctobacter jejuensis TaxID=1439938 RepID=UPI003FD3BF23
MNLFNPGLRLNTVERPFAVVSFCQACKYVNLWESKLGTSMRLDQLDRMTEFAVETLSSGD